MSSVSFWGPLQTVVTPAKASPATGESSFPNCAGELRPIDPPLAGNCSGIDDLSDLLGHDKRAPPKHPSEGPARQVRHFRRDVLVTSALLEGPACQVRSLTLDHPFPFLGHDERAPPKHPSEGPACQVRSLTLDHPFPFRGHDERAPPKDIAEEPACWSHIPTLGESRTLGESIASTGLPCSVQLPGKRQGQFMNCPYQHIAPVASHRSFQRCGVRRVRRFGVRMGILCPSCVGCRNRSR